MPIGHLITLVVPIRKAFHLEDYIDEYHLDNLCKLLLFTSSIDSSPLMQRSNVDLPV